MKVTVRDRDVLGSLRPLEVVAYLRTNGWTKTAERPSQWATWVRPDPASKDEFEIALPLTTDYRDFALRMGDALAVLAVAERRPQLEILRDLQIVATDVVRLRWADGDVTDGSVSLEEGAAFVDRAKDLFQAAACAAAETRAYYPSRKPSQATDYLRQARLAHTEPGSFILTVLSRVPPSLASENGKLFGIDEPFERRVTWTLANALASARLAAEEAVSTGKVASFEEAVPRGVSANLCQALAGMGRMGSGSGKLAVQFTWSPSRPLQADSPAPSRVAISPDMFPVFDQAARYLKESSPRDDFELHGPAVKLVRTEGAPKGQVTIHGFVDEQPRKVAFEIGDPEYRRLATAHADGQVVHCFGTLVREGKTYQLHDPRDMHVETDD